MLLATALIAAIHLGGAHPPPKQVTCLAKNIYHEARGESLFGQIAVAKVTLNRVGSEGYPDTVCGVVHQRTKKVCQFSWVCKPHSIKNVELYKEIKLLAAWILTYQNMLPEIVDGATHYHSVDVSPNWGEPVAVIGNHIFYQ